MDSKLTDFLGVIHMSQKMSISGKKSKLRIIAFLLSDSQQKKEEKRSEVTRTFSIFRPVVAIHSAYIYVAKVISVKNVRAWVSMVSYLKK